MELRQLEYFSAVAREGTYTAAARRLHIAQPAMWKQVHELERELGVALFERVGRRVRITAAGLLLLDRADQLLGGAGRIRTLAHELRLGQTGRVRVGCFAPHIVVFLAPVIAAFRESHPKIAIEISEYGLEGSGAVDPSTSLVGFLRAGATDVITSPPVEDATDLDGFAAYQVTVVAVPPLRDAKEPTARRSRVAVTALRDVPLVVSPPGYFSRQRLEAACRVAGFEPRIEVESSSPAALLALADHGVGTAIVANDAIPTRPVRTLTFEGRAMTETVWLYRESRRRDPAVEAFFAAARSAASTGGR
ncbi:MAG: LysR family transcriptional regulator [Actinobacteria bacterium]|nr:LysR family transcriptional regulator [Actinomycetota bacterium]